MHGINKDLNRDFFFLIKKREREKKGIEVSCQIYLEDNGWDGFALLQLPSHSLNVNFLRVVGGYFPHLLSSSSS